MRASKTIVLILGLALIGGLGASNATSRTVKNVPVCTLGQKSAKAKPCTANPADGVGACASLVPLLQPLAPGAALGSHKNSLAPVGIDCWFLANGERQAFDIQVVGGPSAKASYDSAFQQYTGYANDDTVSCSSGTPQAPLQTVSGLGEKAFAWDSCPPKQTGFLLAAAIQRSTYVYVLANPYLVSPTLDQVESVVRQLLAKFR